jgi:hypothetical protein
MYYTKYNKLNTGKTKAVKNIFKHMMYIIESIKECREYRFGRSLETVVT